MRSGGYRTWWVAGIVCAVLLLAGSTLSAQPASIQGVARIYVEPFPAKTDAGKLRGAFISQLRKLHVAVLVGSAAEADASLSGEGEIWLKGYQSLNPRSGRLPSNGSPVYGGFLSVELIDHDGDVLWSYLASESASDNVYAELARKVAKQLASAMAPGSGR